MTAIKAKTKSSQKGISTSGISVQLDNIPIWYQYALSIVLIIFASFLILPPPKVNLDAPIFQSARDEFGHHFAANRIKEAPILYGWAHGVMGTLWCIGIPLQHNQSIRQSFPVIHRICGRMTILASFSLAISGLLFSPYKMAYSAPLFHLHRFKINQRTILAWPTFDLGVWILGALFFVPTLKTIQTARAKRFEEHRYWAKMLTVTGYVVPLQRVFLLLINFLGFGILPHLSPSQKSFLGCPDTLSISAKSAAEKAAFAWTTWAAAVCMISYTIRIKTTKGLTYNQ